MAFPLSVQGSEDVLTKKLEEVNGELRKAESKNGGLAADLKNTTSALKSSESECSALKARLQELEKHLSASDANKDLAVKLQVSPGCFFSFFWSLCLLLFVYIFCFCRCFFFRCRIVSQMS